MIPRELVVTTANDPYIPINGFIFIWTSMISCMQVQNDSGSVAQGKLNENKRSNGYPRELWM